MQGLEGKSAITGISALKWINTIWNTLVQNANISHSLSARRGLIMGLRETGDEPLFLMKQTHCLETNHMLALTSTFRMCLKINLQFDFVFAC